MRWPRASTPPPTMTAMMSKLTSQAPASPGGCEEFKGSCNWERLRWQLTSEQLCTTEERPSVGRVDMKTDFFFHLRQINFSWNVRGVAGSSKECVLAGGGLHHCYRCEKIKSKKVSLKNLIPHSRFTTRLLEAPSRGLVKKTATFPLGGGGG